MASSVDRRQMCLGVAGAALAATVHAAPRARFDAAIGVGAVPAGVPRFPDLAALLAAPAGQGQAPLRVFVAAGRHLGQVAIMRPDLWLTGAGEGRSVFSAGAYAGQPGPDGRPTGTFRSAVIDVRAAGFRATDLTIENSFDAPAEMRRPGGLRADDPGSQQAIALALSRGADRAIVTNCAITGHQDTLFCADGRQLFRDCRIGGSYDFIFGGGTARFEGCTIVSRPRLDPVEGYIAAPSTLIDRPAGLVFDRCRLVAEPGVPDGSVFLGRPWRTSTSVDGASVPDLRSVGMAAYLRCAMGRHIAPAGWTRMWYDGHRRWFEPEQARFGEWRSAGPGAAGARRGRQLSDAEAAALSRAALFGDWRP